MAKLLLADDSITVRRVVELTFADEGVDVTSTTNAEQAMQKFVEIQPDIVLVDVSLKETDGYEICRMIKEDAATRHIPILLLVGSFEPFDQDKAEQAQADGFLTKPFPSIRDLVTKVFELLGGEKGESAPPAPVPLPEVPEDEDIENLYRSSFAQTADIEEFDTVDDLLGDPAMDDELIEASYASEPGPARNLSQPESDKDERMKEFDWSPSSIVSEPKAAEPEKVFEHDDAPGDAFALQLPELKIANPDKTAVQEDDKPEAPVSPAALAEPSDEIIEIIVQKVIERMSDQAVREIAREAVPRIAEKMIREALAEENSE